MSLLSFKVTFDTFGCRCRDRRLSHDPATLTVMFSKIRAKHLSGIDGSEEITPLSTYVLM